MIDHSVELINKTLSLTVEYGENNIYTFERVSLKYLKQNEIWYLDYDDSWAEFQKQDIIKLSLTDSEVT